MLICQYIFVLFNCCELLFHVTKAVVCVCVCVQTTLFISLSLGGTNSTSCFQRCWDKLDIWAIKTWHVLATHIILGILTRIIRQGTLFLGNMLACSLWESDWIPSGESLQSKFEEGKGEGPENTIWPETRCTVTFFSAVNKFHRRKKLVKLEFCNSNLKDHG